MTAKGAACGHGGAGRLVPHRGVGPPTPAAAGSGSAWAHTTVAQLRMVPRSEASAPTGDTAAPPGRGSLPHSLW